MRRRKLITSTVAGESFLSGCGKLTNTTTNGNEQVSISQSKLDTKSPLEYNLELVNKDISTEPVQIRITLTNTAEKEYKYVEARNAKFIGMRASNRDEFVLYPEQFIKDNYSSDNETDVWVADEYLVQTADYKIDSLEGGESTSVVLFFLHEPTNEDTNKTSTRGGRNDIFLHESHNEGAHISPYPESISFASEISVYEGENGIFGEGDGTTSNISFTLDLNV